MLITLFRSELTDNISQLDGFPRLQLPEEESVTNLSGMDQ